MKGARSAVRSGPGRRRQVRRPVAGVARDDDRAAITGIDAGSRVAALRRHCRSTRHRVSPAAPADRRADMEPQRATRSGGSTPAVGPARRLRRCPVSPRARRSPQPIAALRGVGRTFDDVVALTGVDLAIARGSIVGVIGPSGAGKTTAIRLLTGALRPTSGEAEVLGGDPTRLPAETRARIGFMPQHVSLYDDLTVGENLDFVASLYGLFLFRRRARIRALLDWLELTDARKRRAGDLSGGMRRRLQLACALVHDPELVFLDEPTAGIDPLVRQSIWRELHRLREAGRTLLITTQYVPEAEECDVVALIAEGRLIAFDTPEALRQRAFGGQLLEIARRRQGPVVAFGAVILLRPNVTAVYVGEDLAC